MARTALHTPAARCHAAPPSATDRPATVEVVETKGADTDLNVKAGEWPLTCVARERLRFAMGDTVHLGVDAAHGHFFDPQSGKRIGSPVVRTEAAAA
jgi:ABC-type sugar transport system ATPase subunit